MRTKRGVGALIGLAIGLSTGSVFAQGGDEEEPTLGWANETELSLAMTAGNSGARTFGFSNTLRHIWETSQLQIRLNGIRSDTSDDRFLLVEPGIRFPVGATPMDAGTTLVTPSVTPDVENYLISGRYDRELTERFFWNAGGSWDRNRDAGILNRYIAFGGVGNIWHDSEDLRFATTYAVSYTDREEETPDPEKDDRFAGARLGWDYLNRFGDATTYENELVSNINLANASDFSLNMVNALSVSLNSHLSLRVSLQFLYENEPALEDIDIIARTVLIDPDGIPGSGDELFETVADVGAEVDLGGGRVRKERLDAIFRTALVVSF